jgi:hypothetical protein
MKGKKSNYINAHLLSVLDDLIEMLSPVTVTSHKGLFDDNVE